MFLQDSTWRNEIAGFRVRTLFFSTSVMQHIMVNLTRSGSCWQGSSPLTQKCGLNKKKTTQISTHTHTRACKRNSAFGLEPGEKVLDKHTNITRATTRLKVTVTRYKSILDVCVLKMNTFNSKFTHSKQVLSLSLRCLSSVRGGLHLDSGGCKVCGGGRGRLQTQPVPSHWANRRHGGHTHQQR